MIEHFWYKKNPIRWVLWPFSIVYQGIIKIRRRLLTRFSQKNWFVPVIVVGNLTVGGVGKTPLVIALAQAMVAKGVRVGIVSRGYGARIKHYPHEVSVTDSSFQVGDEPLLMARKSGCPVVIAPNRAEAVDYMIEHHQPQIIISDDGLQHYRMGRAIEIVVIDGLRGFGNGFCLPAGPLREPISRIDEVDFLVVNQGSWPGAYPMIMEPGSLRDLKFDKPHVFSTLSEPIAAVAGIGNPQRFFNTLEGIGLTIEKYPFPDHHLFHKNELKFKEETVIMTEKDAVKCKEFAENSWYYLPIEAKLSDSFWRALWSHDFLKGFN